MTRERSRFRLTPSLVLSSMISGVMDKHINESTGTMLRGSNLQAVTAPPSGPKLAGCQAAGCRQFVRCICRCKRCRVECLYRDAVASLKDDGLVHLEHLDGEPILKLTEAEYEELRALNKRLPPPVRQTGLTRR